MKKLSNLLFILLAIVAIIFIFSNYLVFHRSDNKQVKIFAVEKNQGISEIADNLKSQGFIGSKFVFEGYVIVRGFSRRLQAGKYELSAGMSIKDIAYILAFGNALSQEKTITVIEGWDNKEIAAYLDGQGIASRDIFLAETKNYQTIANFDFLDDKPGSASLEGYLFPDTYRIGPRENADNIIEKMLNNFSGKLTEKMKEDMRAQHKTIFEVVTIASILEKEVANPEDRKMVADIFYKRLKAGMPLQADSTVNYITGGTSKSVSLKDTKINSPYNTYKYRGLPPGPICNPGLSAIEATIYPTPNNYWYFLSADDGRTIFSKTLEKHNINKRKWLK